MSRAIVAVILVAVVAGIAWTALDRGGDPTAGTHHLIVDTPDGRLFEGNVSTQDNTAFSVLATAGEMHGFAVIHSGTGASLFVTSIAGTANAGSGGWCFLIQEAEGWRAPHAGAGTLRLEPGQGLWWRYEAGGCPDGA